MKNSLCVLLLCLFTLMPLGSEAEARWVYVQSDNAHFERIDNSHIALNDNVLVFWHELYFKDKGSSIVTRVQCDLDKFQYRTTYAVVYTRNGDPVILDQVSKWMPIIPNSRFENTVTKVLSYYSKNA